MRFLWIKLQFQLKKSLSMYQIQKVLTRGFYFERDSRKRLHRAWTPWMRLLKAVDPADGWCLGSLDSSSWRWWLRLWTHGATGSALPLSPAAVAASAGRYGPRSTLCPAHLSKSTFSLLCRILRQGRITARRPEIKLQRYACHISILEKKWIGFN